MPRSDYRKHKGSGYYAWHFCTNCPYWPIHAYDSRRTPHDLSMCDKCQQLERDGGCT
jgi:hypothetical protein